MRDSSACHETRSLGNRMVNGDKYTAAPSPVASVFDFLRWRGSRASRGGNAYMDWGLCLTIGNARSGSFCGSESRMMHGSQTKSEIGMYIGLGTLLLIVLAIWFFRRA
jgi:hypothetical protein